MKRYWKSTTIIEEYASSGANSQDEVISNCSSISFMVDPDSSAERGRVTIDGVFTMEKGDSMLTFGNDPSVVETKQYKISFNAAGVKLKVFKVYTEEISYDQHQQIQKGGS